CPRRRVRRRVDDQVGELVEREGARRGGEGDAQQEIGLVAGVLSNGAQGARGRLRGGGGRMLERGAHGEPPVESVRERSCRPRRVSYLAVRRERPRTQRAATTTCKEAWPGRWARAAIVTRFG